MSTDTASAESAPERADRGFFGQPRSLAHIFGVEMWERFSFYGMQGILLLYLYYSVAHGGLGVPKAAAAGIVGAYGGGVYLSTIIGAWLADRVLGSERVLFASAVVIVCGHIALAVIPGIAGVAVGLILVALGSGGLKANATRVVGTLYAPDDVRRDAGFSVFYLGINLGAFVGPLATGALQSSIGFHYGFGAAAVGMILGLIQYAIGRRHLPEQARVVPNPLPRSRRVLMLSVAVVAIAVIVALVLTRVITAGNLVTVVIGITLAAAIAYFVVILTSRTLSATERRRIYAFIPLFVASTAFWALYQQQFTVLTIYSADRLDRDVLGFTFPIPWVQSINPIFIIVLSGVFAAIWTRMGDRQPSTPLKFGAANIFMGVAFLIFLAFAGTGKNGTPVLALVLILFVFTIAELLLSPVGLSVSTKLAPEKFQTQMVALFFLSVALGTALSGRLAEFYTLPSEPVYFGISGLVSIAIGVLVIVFARPVLRLMSGVR
jgi:proton-dependent oligopeptide transporter, POT family